MAVAVSTDFYKLRDIILFVAGVKARVCRLLFINS